MVYFRVFCDIKSKIMDILWENVACASGIPKDHLSVGENGDFRLGKVRYFV